MAASKQAASLPIDVCKQMRFRPAARHFMVQCISVEFSRASKTFEGLGEGLSTRDVKAEANFI
jgi:hypothetical protein